MKVASVVFKREDMSLLKNNKSFVYKIHHWLDCCMKEEIDIVVLPGLIGCLYGEGESYLDCILNISMEYKRLYICPGSYFEVDKKQTYHSSSIIHMGKICLIQRQLYLARWEKNLGLSRGRQVDFANINGMKTAIMLTTDMFYPQVSRFLAMTEADLVLAPSAIKGGENMAFQLSGLWQNVQQNLFFAVESGFKGTLLDCRFFSRSAIYAPLEMTDKDNGFINLERNNWENNIITAQLDNEKRLEAKKRFDVLKQLNIDLYKDIFR